MSISVDQCRIQLERQIEALDNALLDASGEERKILEARRAVGYHLLASELFIRPRVFVSRRFDDYGDQLFERCQTIFEDVQIKPIQGRESEQGFSGSDDLDRGIGEVMISCHFFLAILTPRDGTKPMDEQVLSPWYMLEYGMALMHSDLISYRFISDAPVPTEQLPVPVTKREVTPFPHGNMDEFDSIIARVASDFRLQWDNRGV